MDALDCTWCGSARSIEYGICQVCLMRIPDEALGDDVVVELRDLAAPPRPAPKEQPSVESAAE